MGIFTKDSAKKILGATIKEATDAISSPKERADSALNWMQVLKITPSAKTRRFMAIGQALWMAVLLSVGLFVDKYSLKDAIGVIEAYGTNWVIVSINVFIFGGYYAPKVLNERQKAKVARKEKEDEVKIKERELELEIEARKQNLSLSKREDRLARRRERRNR